eukprot:11801588-Prorocentrum_lima.AAC.1
MQVARLQRASHGPLGSRASRCPPTPTLPLGGSYPHVLAYTTIDGNATRRFEKGARPLARNGASGP